MFEHLPSFPTWTSDLRTVAVIVCTCVHLGYSSIVVRQKYALFLRNNVFNCTTVQLTWIFCVQSSTYCAFYTFVKQICDTDRPRIVSIMLRRTVPVCNIWRHIISWTGFKLVFGDVRVMALVLVSYVHVQCIHRHTHTCMSLCVFFLHLRCCTFI